MPPPSPDRVDRASDAHSRGRGDQNCATTTTTTRTGIGSSTEAPATARPEQRLKQRRTVRLRTVEGIARSARLPLAVGPEDRKPVSPAPAHVAVVAEAVGAAAIAAFDRALAAARAQARARADHRRPRRRVLATATAAVIAARATEARLPVVAQHAVAVRARVRGRAAGDVDHARDRDVPRREQEHRCVRRIALELDGHAGGNVHRRVVQDARLGQHDLGVDRRVEGAVGAGAAAVDGGLRAGDCQHAQQEGDRGTAPRGPLQRFR